MADNERSQRCTQWGNSGHNSTTCDEVLSASNCIPCIIEGSFKWIDSLRSTAVYFIIVTALNRGTVNANPVQTENYAILDVCR